MEVIAAHPELQGLRRWLPPPATPTPSTPSPASARSPARRLSWRFTARTSTGADRTANWASSLAYEVGGAAVIGLAGRRRSGTSSGIELAAAIEEVGHLNWFAGAALVWGALTLGSCSSERLVASSDGNVDAPANLDAGGIDRCTGSLDALNGRCPATFDGTAADLPACTGVGQMVSQCGDVVVLSQGNGFTGLVCYYDAGTHVLIGGLETSDGLGFCSARLDGQGPAPPCNYTAFSIDRSCRDAGVD